jgi:hypothetical protein
MERSCKMMKVICPDHEEDLILRITRHQLSRGFPFCGVCRKRMVLDCPSVSVDGRNSRLSDDCRNRNWNPQDTQQT